MHSDLTDEPEREFHWFLELKTIRYEKLNIPVPDVLANGKALFVIFWDASSYALAVNRPLWSVFRFSGQVSVGERIDNGDGIKSKSKNQVDGSSLCERGPAYLSLPRYFILSHIFHMETNHCITFTSTHFRAQDGPCGQMNIVDFQHQGTGLAQKGVDNLLKLQFEGRDEDAQS